MNKEELKRLVNENIVHLSDEIFVSLESLMQDTLLTNEKFNLTAITDVEEFRELMLYDSLLPLKYFDFTNKKVVDVGTGAGYPGLPLALASKGQFILLDATSKKINHINEYVFSHNIRNVEGVVDRAEMYARKHRETYDFVIARAVAPLHVLLELCIPMLKVGGTFIAMKSNKVDMEIKEAEGALKKLKCSIVDNLLDYLPLSQAERNMIVIKKDMITPSKFPRDYSDIKNKRL